MINEINKVTADDFKIMGDITNHDKVVIGKHGPLYISKELADKLQCYPVWGDDGKPCLVVKVIDDNIEICMFVGTNSICPVNDYIGEELTEILKSRVREALNART